MSKDKKSEKKRSAGRIKKASDNPVEEAMSHPSGPSLGEMLSGQEEKAPKKGKKKAENGSPEGGPIPVI
jgi:hypothetical protein